MRAVENLPSSLIIRGIISILFGIAAFLLPGAALLTVAWVFGAYALVDGISALVSAGHMRRTGGRVGFAVFEGIIGVLAGIGTFLYPGITVLALAAITGAWALLTGGAELFGAFALGWAAMGFRLLLGIAGALSIALGIGILAYPLAGAFALLALLGAYAIAFGVVLVAMGIRSHRHVRSLREPAPPTINRAA